MRGSFLIDVITHPYPLALNWVSLWNDLIAIITMPPSILRGWPKAIYRLNEGDVVWFET